MGGIRCYGSILVERFAQRPVCTLTRCAVWSRSPGRSGLGEARRFRARADGSIVRYWHGGRMAMPTLGCCSLILPRVQARPVGMGCAPGLRSASRNRQKLPGVPSGG
jgi:hypothetical protein